MSRRRIFVLLALLALLWSLVPISLVSADTRPGQATQGCVTGEHVAYSTDVAGWSRVQIRFRLIIEPGVTVGGRWEGSNGAVGITAYWSGGADGYDHFLYPGFTASYTGDTRALTANMVPGSSGTIRFVLRMPHAYDGCYQISNVVVERFPVAQSVPEPPPGGGGFSPPPSPTPTPTGAPTPTPAPTAPPCSAEPGFDPEECEPPEGFCYGYGPVPEGSTWPIYECNTPEATPSPTPSATPPPSMLFPTGGSINPGTWGLGSEFEGGTVTIPTGTRNVILTNGTGTFGANATGCPKIVTIGYEIGGVLISYAQIWNAATDGGAENAVAPGPLNWRIETGVSLNANGETLAPHEAQFILGRASCFTTLTSATGGADWDITFTNLAGEEVTGDPEPTPTPTGAPSPTPTPTVPPNWPTAPPGGYDPAQPGESGDGWEDLDPNDVGNITGPFSPDANGGTGNGSGVGPCEAPPGYTPVDTKPGYIPVPEPQTMPDLFQQIGSTALVPPFNIVVGAAKWIGQTVATTTGNATLIPFQIWNRGVDAIVPGQCVPEVLATGIEDLMLIEPFATYTEVELQVQAAIAGVEGADPPEWCVPLPGGGEECLPLASWAATIAPARNASSVVVWLLGAIGALSIITGSFRVARAGSFRVETDEPTVHLRNL